MDKILDFIKDKGREIYDIPLIGFETQTACLELAKEEPSELIQAVTKLKRVYSKKNSTQCEILKEGLVYKGINKNRIKILEQKVEELTKLEDKYRDNLCEEMADVINILIMLFCIYNVQEDEVLKWLDKKYDRMMKRIEEGDFY